MAIINQNVDPDQVIRYLREKDANGAFQNYVTWIGAEQRYVNSMRQSNVNNLEEQLIIGTDTYTIFDEDDEGNQQEIKHFCPALDDQDLSNADEYYKLVTTTMQDGVFRHYNFDDGLQELKLSNYFQNSYFGTGDPSSPYPNEDTIYFINTIEIPTFYFIDDDELFKIQPSEIDTERQELFFVKGEDEYRVITKEKATLMRDDTQIAIREKIINHLKG